jgi:hypothetical protein
MTIKEIRERAKLVGVNVNKMKKADAIRTIQRAEDTYECFGTQRVLECGENGCLWRQDCVKMH